MGARLCDMGTVSAAFLRTTSPWWSKPRPTCMRTSTDCRSPKSSRKVLNFRASACAHAGGRAATMTLTRARACPGLGTPPAIRVPLCHQQGGQAGSELGEPGSGVGETGLLYRFDRGDRGHADDYPGRLAPRTARQDRAYAAAPHGQRTGAGLLSRKEEGEGARQVCAPYAGAAGSGSPVRVPPPPSLKARKRREGRGGALASDAQGSPRLCCNRRRGVRPRRGPYSIISALLRLLDDNQYQAMLDTASKIPVLDIVKCKAFGRCQTARPTRRRGRGGRDGTTAAFASYG